MAADRAAPDTPGPVRRLVRGVQTSLRNNASAYPFSVFITASFGVLDTVVGGRDVGRIFLVVIGSTLAFTVLEAIASRGFRNRLRPARSEVVVLGSAMAMISATSAVGAVWLTCLVMSGAFAWFVGSFVGTIVYVTVSSAEMALARRQEEAQGNAPQESEQESHPDHDVADEDAEDDREASDSGDP